MNHNYRQEQEKSQVALFKDRLVRNPFVSEDLSCSFQVFKPQSFAYKYIQANHECFYNCVVFDVDKKDSNTLFIDAMAPPPNIICLNEKNGHSHYIYNLEVPVHKFSNARERPLNWLEGLYAKLLFLLGADPAYSGFLCKNPLSYVWLVNEAFIKPYTLSELDMWLNHIDIPKKHQNRNYNYLSRNVYVFDETRLWAYQAIKAMNYPNYDIFFPVVLEKCNIVNATDIKPKLCLNELKHIARSIAKWTCRHFSQEGYETFCANLNKMVNARKTITKELKLTECRKIQQTFSNISNKKLASYMEWSERTIQLHRAAGRIL